MSPTRRQSRIGWLPLVKAKYGPPRRPTQDRARLKDKRLLNWFIIGANFVESRAAMLDLEQFYGNGRAMGQNASFSSRCITNAS
ncbi:MAG: hypothetical protein WAN43_02895 [Rhodomicrobium sp.]|jgi:hypothetical protein